MKIKYLLLFLIIFIFTACKKDTEEEVIRAVKIQEINSMQDENFNIDFPAQISPTQKTILAFKYAGKIKSINFESGDFVKKGQVIATMDDKDYKVNLEAFSKKYEAAKAVAQNAETQFARAPYDGYIDKKIVEVGTVVPEGGPVISFISSEITDISVNASSKDIEYIKNANDIIFKDNSSEKTYPLKVKSIAQNPDTINLTYPVTFTFSNLNEGEKFLSGQTGTVTVNVKNNGNQEILIPLNAVFEDNGSNVYLFKNGIAVKTPIEIGELKETDKISVVKGLKSGDKVIVAGVSKLADGEKVKLLGGSK